LRTSGTDIDIKDIEPVNSIWNHRLTSIQRDAFTDLANKAKIINKNVAQANEDSNIRMIQNDAHQETNHPFAISFFGGTKNFSEKTDFDVLMPGSSFF